VAATFETDGQTNLLVFTATLLSNKHTLIPKYWWKSHLSLQEADQPLSGHESKNPKNKMIYICFLTVRLLVRLNLREV